MRTRVQKWGNSLAVRLPRSIAADAGLDTDTSVEVVLREGSVVVTRVAEPAFTLDQLLSQITPENAHGEVDTGSAVGGEVC
jgi:antitoxin MazE